MDSSKENDIIRSSFGAGTTADYGGSSSVLLLLDIAERGLSKTLGSACRSDTLEDLMASSEIPVCRIRPLFGVVVTIPILPHHLGGGKRSDRPGSSISIGRTHRQTRGRRDPWNLKIGFRDIYAIMPLRKRFKKRIGCHLPLKALSRSFIALE
jgi:hypothetical protein